MKGLMSQGLAGERADIEIVKLTEADLAPRELGAVLAERDVQRLVPLHGGGTPAQVWLATRSTGGRFVIKYLDAAAGLVDGHDLRTFRLKQEQIARIHAELGRLSPSYVQVTGAWHGTGWAAYAMPYYEGACITQPLRGEDHDLSGFLSALRAVLETLTEHGYAARDWPAPAGHFLTTHVGRVRRRLPLLRAHLDPCLFDGPGVWVNGRRRPPLTRLLDRLGGDHGLAADLQPARLHYPVHGDLNLGNVVMRNGSEFTILDPRGVLEPWDVVYDMAKILFSLTVFELAMEGGFAIRRETSPDLSPHYLFALRRPRPAYFAAARRVPRLLGSLPFFCQLDRADPNWRARLAFAHGVHCLAEAACRLSDRKPRDPDPTRQWPACLERACGLLLTGLALLDDLLEARATTGLAALEEIACLHRVTQPRHSSAPYPIRTI
jgi:hypothetical protein